MTAQAKFRQEDVKRAVKGCAAAGMLVGQVRILPDGTVEVYAVGEGEPSAGANPLDRILPDAA